MVARATAIAVFLTFAAVTGCATTTRANLSNAAENLEYNANVLVHDSGDDAYPPEHRSDGTADYPGYSTAHEYSRDARALARSAHELRLAVDARASDSEVRAAFDRVSRSYHAVRDEVAHADSLQARRDFAPVTDSYRAIEHELGIAARRDEHVPPA
ncbi:MAG: hypothetical protein JO184_08355 [Gammaproteobacteria bacterium]|nr:hypothetical protein [Gammaproteobacteria bacterium]MBV8307001.1 hypothetical protein [Gammaproteobacteria bacterium]